MAQVTIISGGSPVPSSVLVSRDLTLHGDGSSENPLGVASGPAPGFLPSADPDAVVLSSGDNNNVQLPGLGFPGTMRFTFTSGVNARLNSIATVGTTIATGNMILLENANPKIGGAPIVVTGEGLGLPGNTFSTELILAPGTVAWYVYDGTRWLPTASVLGAPVFPVLPFVFRPGGVAGSNVYTDWPTLMLAIGVVTGLRIIQFDDSIVSPCVIPTSAGAPGGVWDLTNVALQGLTFRVTFAQINEGAILVGARQFSGQISVTFVGTTAPISDLLNNEIIVLDIGSALQSTTAPMIEMSSLTAGQSAIIVLREGGKLVNAGAPVVAGSVPNTSFAVIAVASFSEINTDTISGTDPTTTLLIAGNANPPLGVVSVDQPQFAGPIILLVQPPRWNVEGPATGDINATIGNVVICNPTGGGFNVFMPPAFNNSGEQIVVKNQSASANVITVLPVGGDTIDGGASDTVSGARASKTYTSDGISDWMVVAV